MVMQSRAKNFPMSAENWLMAISIALGGIVSAALALATNYPFFFREFLAFWGLLVAELAVGTLAMALIYRSSGAAISGIAFSLCLYLGLFATWLLTRTHIGPFLWLAYFFSLPGGAIGALLAGFTLRKQATFGTLAAALLASAYVGAGIAINQIVVCSTLIYCGGK